METCAVPARSSAYEQGLCFHFVPYSKARSIHFFLVSDGGQFDDAMRHGNNKTKNNNALYKIETRAE